MTLLEYFRAKVAALQPSTCLVISNDELRFPDKGVLHSSPEFGGFLTFAGLKMADMILDGIIGASYEYGYLENPTTGKTMFFRRREPFTEESRKRTYVSPDRRHMFEFDGEAWRLKGEYHR